MLKSLIMKHDLKDITFLILVQTDTVERIENLLASTNYLISNFDTKVEVLEVASYRNGIIKKLLKKKKLDFLKKHTDKMTEMYPPDPTGGVFFCKLDLYKKLDLKMRIFMDGALKAGKDISVGSTQNLKQQELKEFFFT